MTGGLAFEGLNNAGASRGTDLLVILNDNNMAIDQATGALKSCLLKLSTSKHYNRFKQSLWRTLHHAPRVLHLCQKAWNGLKQGLLNNSNLFESLDFRYFGPIDGHNLPELVRTLRALREIEGPKLLHVMTTKGKGYLPAEHDQPTWHAPGRFNPDTGERIAAKGATARYQDVFGRTLVELARADARVVGVTPAMPTGCSMNLLMQEMPRRCFDVGIAEGHAVTFSAGLAAAGMVPFCNIYSTFMQRAYDNVIHDVAIQGLPVVMCLDRGGLVGEDGVTHHGLFDMAAFAAVPGLTIAAPMDERELRNLMYTALHAGKPFMIRYPRGGGAGAAWEGMPFETLPEGRGRRLRTGSDVALLTVGTTGNAGARAAERAAAAGTSVAHYDLRFVKPLDEELLDEVGRTFRRVVTVEDGCLRGGVGEAVAAFFNRRGHDVAVRTLGIGDAWIDHGTPRRALRPLRLRRGGHPPRAHGAIARGEGREREHAPKHPAAARFTPRHPPPLPAAHSTTRHAPPQLAPQPGALCCHPMQSPPQPDPHHPPRRPRARHTVRHGTATFRRRLSRNPVRTRRRTPTLPGPESRPQRPARRRSAAPERSAPSIVSPFPLP